MDRAQLTMVGSGFSALLSMHFTIQLLSQHLFFWKNPKEQKAIIMIICMAPLYAIDSFVGLLDIRGSKTFFMFLDSVKECYEAVVSCYRVIDMPLLMAHTLSNRMLSSLTEKIKQNMFHLMSFFRQLPNFWL